MEVGVGSWRGTVGIIKPNFRPGSTEDLIRVLPRGIGVVPLHIDHRVIRNGTQAEFVRSHEAYEPQVALLAELGVDLIHPAGSPPFVVHGYAGEREILDRWEAKYKTPIFTNGTNQINALRVFGAHRVVGVTYFRGEINTLFATYLTEAGFDVLDMAGMNIDFGSVETASPNEVYRFIRGVVRKHRNVDAIYSMGPAWPTLEIVETLEQDLGIPFVDHIAAQSWEIQRRFGVRQPLAGYGRLLREMPDLPEPALVAAVR
jgi:maleate isomerase